jgi:integrase
VASVYLKRGTWYLRVRDAGGRWIAKASAARTKTEAKRLAVEMELRHERQRAGLEPPDLEEGGGTVQDLVEWWIRAFMQPESAHQTTISSVRKHIIGSSLAKLTLTEVTPGKIDLFLLGKERTLSPKSVNHLRGYLSRAFNLARRMDKFPRANPVADVPKRKVPKRIPDYLRPHEVSPLLAALRPNWRGLFATAIYTGMRKGELFALRKLDVDFSAGLVTVARSHDRDTTKGGRAEAVPINRELVPYLEKALAVSPSDLVFPAADGEMLKRQTQLEHVLRRAMRRAGLVTGYVHKCRRQGCGHQEPARDANSRRCPKCNFKLFPVGTVRKIRFHHLRRTTASLLLMSGAGLAAVQRIMRHQDRRTTTEFYGHLATSYLQTEVDRLSFGPPPSDPNAAERSSEQQSLRAAGGAMEPPLPAASHTDAAPFVTRLLPEGENASKASLRRRPFGKDRRRLAVVGATGFEPATFRSRTERATRLRHAPEETSRPRHPPQHQPRDQERRNLTRRSATSARKTRIVTSSSGVRSGRRVLT